MAYILLEDSLTFYRRYEAQISTKKNLRWVFSKFATFHLEFLCIIFDIRVYSFSQIRIAHITQTLIYFPWTDKTGET